MQRRICTAWIAISLLLFFLSACERTNNVCPPEAAAPGTSLPLSELLKSTPDVTPATHPIQVEIRGRLMEVDKIVDYPLCNDDWSGTVYVTCDAQVADADLDEDANPLFLKGCDLNIAPNTVVYVAAHNDAPYYKGCSCHTGKDPVP